MHWEESDNQSFLWSGNPRSSVIVEGTAKPSYSRPGAMALSRGNFVFYLKAACPTLNNWDWFVWSSLLCCLLSLLTTKIWTREENTFFFWKNNNKKFLYWGTLAERSLIFSKTKLSLRQYIDILSKCAQKWQALLFLSQSERWCRNKFL